MNYATTTSRGSSPLARGTRFEVCHSLEVVGLIPARAGNTVARKFAGSSSRAHPRSRGEHCVWMVGVGGILGSSPLARGTLQTAGDSGHKKGLIPARAGNTPPPRLSWTLPRAHPRSRGEHIVQAAISLAPAGSSPLARGTRHDRLSSFPARGLIPARAGNTRSLPPCSSRSRAHPRSRGEHPVEPTPYLVRKGSSPLARGTRCGHLLVSWSAGLIPARAGNTYRFASTRTRRGAHPRSRGEHTLSFEFF